MKDARGVLRAAAWAVLEFALTTVTVISVGYAVVGESPFLTLSAVLVGLILSRSRRSIRRGGIARRLLIAIPTGIGGVLIAIAFRSGSLIALDTSQPVPLLERVLVATLLFGAFGAIVGFVYDLVLVRRVRAGAGVYWIACVAGALLFVVVQVAVAGWPTAALWSGRNLHYLGALFTGILAGLALVIGLVRFGQPAGIEMRRAMREIGRARPYLQAMLRPVEALVLIYVGLILVFACIYASAYRIDPQGAFSRGAARDEPAFADFVYFSVVTMGTVGYGDITPTSVFTRTVAMVEILFAAFFLVVTFAALTAYLQQAWAQLAAEQEAARRRPPPVPDDE